MTPNISTGDYQKLLQKIAVLETEIFQLKQSRGLDKPPAWDKLGAKPKEMKERITGKTRSPAVIDLTGWPALPVRQNDSTPVQQTQPLQWSTAKKGAKATDNPPQTPCVQLANRFTPLLMEDPRYVSEDRDSVSPSWLTIQLKEPSVSPRRVRTQTNSDPEILIVADDAVKDVKSIRNSKVLCFPKDNVSDINDRILDVVAAHPTVKTLILHIGTNDIEEKKSEVLKQHFKALFATLKSLDSDVRVCISGPLPSMSGGDEYFSRLFALSQWLSTACVNESVKFIDNFGFFWDRKHLFADGNKLNKRGLKLFAANVSYSIGMAPLKARAKSVPPLSEEKQKTNDNDFQPSAAPVKVAEKTTDSATELPHVTAPLVESQSANESTLTGEEVTNEESSTNEEEEESSPHVEGASCIESRPHVEGGQAINKANEEESLLQVEGGQAINEEKSANEEEQEEATSESGNDEGPQDLSSYVDSFSLSPMPLLEFSKDMNALIATGIKMTPRAKRQAPQPPTLSTTQTRKSVAWVIAPPPIPPRRHRKSIIASQLIRLDTSFDN